MNLEGGAWWYAHVVELPGCFSRGVSRAEALGALPGAVDARLSWLGKRGLTCPGGGGFTVIEEQVGVAELGESGGAVALFLSDLEPVDALFIAEAKRLMTLSRGELLGLVSGLDEDALDAEPILGKRSLRRDLNHVVNAEEWYVSRLGHRYQEVYERGLRAAVGRGRLFPVARLEATRPHMVAALEAALADGKQGPFTRGRYTRHPKERWTLRKVLRRFLEHEREHIGTMERTLKAIK